MPLSHKSQTMGRVEAPGQIFKQVQSFTYLEGAVAKIPDMSIENAKRTCACSKRVRLYLRELCNQQNVALSLDPSGKDRGNRDFPVWIQ